MKIIDLSIPIEDGLPSDPPMQIPKITYYNHKDSLWQFTATLPNVTKEDLPGGNSWAVELLSACSHAGTHVDAPYHYYPTMNEGEPAWTIDEVPLEWFMGDGVVLDFSNKEDGYRISKQDIEEYLSRINYKIKEGDIVLLRTDASKYWGEARYLGAGAGMSAEAVLYLLDMGVHVMGTDAWSMDIPMKFQGEEFDKNHDPSILWEAHRAGMKKAYCHMEKLTNLDKLPITGFYVICLPVKIKKASAGWTRAIAVIKE